MAGLTIVLVTWADAHAAPHEWTPLEELADDNDEFLVRSVGFLADDYGKHGHVTLVQSITPDDDADHTLHIPVGMVRSVVVLCSTQDVVSR